MIKLKVYNGEKTEIIPVTKNVLLSLVCTKEEGKCVNLQDETIELPAIDYAESINLIWATDNIVMMKNKPMLALGFSESEIFVTSE